jgi:hypothetical protein
MEISGEHHVPATLLPGKSLRYPLDMRLGGPQSRSGRYGGEKKSLAPTGNRTPAVQSVARRYSDWAIPAPINEI